MITGETFAIVGSRSCPLPAVKPSPMNVDITGRLSEEWISGVTGARKRSLRARSGKHAMQTKCIFVVVARFRRVSNALESG